MNKILLINSFFEMKEKYLRFEPPFGLFAIATPLIKSGYQVTLIEPRLENGYLKKIKDALAENILFVGMTTSMGSNVSTAVKLSNYIKEISPATPIVWGGPLATSSPELCFRGAAVDYIVMGMGEETVIRLADSLSEQTPATRVPNVSSNINNKLTVKEKFYFQGSLDEMDYARLDIGEKGIRKDASIPLLSSRGCPRNCAFCYNNTFIGRKKWYARSAESVLAEMDYWAEYFGLNSFYFIDDNFLIDHKRAYCILEKSLERKYEIKYIQGHLNDYTPEVIELIPGYINKVDFSIESASAKIQKLINKPINLQKALDLFEYFTQKGVRDIVTNFMFGFPTESDEDILSNILIASVVHKINDKIRMVPYIYTPQPGDDIIASFQEYRNRIKFSLDNLSTSDFAPNRNKFISHELRPWMSKDDVQFYLDLVLVWFYHFDYVVRKDQRIDVKAIYKRNKRLNNLFRNVPAP